MPKTYGSQLDLSKIPVLGLVAESSADSSPPANPVNGQFWFDATAGRMKFREGGAWVLASNTGVELQANKGAAGGYASLDGSTKVPLAQLPTGQTGTTIPLGNDARFTDARTPTGAATGDLTGNYPAPTIANLAVTDAKVAAANKDGAAGTPSMRTLGTGATQALPGNTRLDTLASPTADVALAGFRITGLGAPTADTDAATKLYVDLARQGLRQKDAVRVITTTNVNLASPGATLDGVAMQAGDRFLAAGQTDHSTDGIYVWNGAAAAATRAADADTFAELQDGAVTFVQQGTNANTTWAQINTLASLATAQSWVQQGAAVNYVWGAALVQTGNTIDVGVDGSSIEVNADALRVKAGGITNAMLAGSIDLTTKVTGALPVANGGTGATTAAGARAAIGANGKFAATLGALAAGVETTITHNLNSTDVGAWFKKVATGFDEGLAWRTIDANTIGVTADMAYAANALRVTVMG